MNRQRTFVVVSALTLGLGGCLHGSPGSSHFVKVTPVAANIPAVSPNAAEDRLYARAAQAIEQRDYGTALDVLQVAKAARPNDPRVLTAMGVVYDKQGRFDLSGRYYDLAEKADPGSKVVAIDRRYSLLLQQRAGRAGVAALAETHTAAQTVAPPDVATPARATPRRPWCGACGELKHFFGMGAPPKAASDRPMEARGE